MKFLLSIHRAGPWKGSGKSQSSNHAGSGKRLSTSHSQPGESDGKCLGLGYVGVHIGTEFDVIMFIVQHERIRTVSMLNTLIVNVRKRGILVTEEISCVYLYTSVQLSSSS